MSAHPDPAFLRVDAVRSRLGVDVCTLYSARTRENELMLHVTSGLNHNVVGTRLPFGQGLTGKVARRQAPLAARDIQSHRDHYHVEGSGEERFRSYLGIPLLREDHLLGVLVIQTEETKTFFQRDIRELYEAARDLMDDLMPWVNEVSELPGHST